MHQTTPTVSILKWFSHDVDDLGYRKISGNLNIHIDSPNTPKDGKSIMIYCDDVFRL